MSHTLLYNVLIPFIKGLVTVVAVGLAAGVLTWIERRLLGRLQIRKGPNRVGPQGFFQWIADTIKLDLQGRHRPVEGGEGPPPPRAAPPLHPGRRRPRPRSVGAGAHPLRRDDPAPRGGRPERRTPPDPRGLHDRRLRDHPLGLGVELEVPAPRRPALGRAAHQLRGADGARGRLRDPDVGLPLDGRDHRGAAEGGRLVRLPRPHRLLPLLRLRRRRDEPDALRPPRGRERARRRVPHRVLGVPLGRLLHVRVREHDLHLGRRDDALLRWLAPPLPERGVARRSWT